MAAQRRAIVVWIDCFCQAGAVVFDLTTFAPRVEAHSHAWDSLDLTWSVSPIHPNYGKAMTWASFESTEWLAQISIWDSGEVDLDTVRLRDRQVINKHYELVTVADLDSVIDEVISLLRDGETPSGAFMP